MRFTAPRLVLAGLTMLGTMSVADASSFSADVEVRVKLITSSGVCGGAVTGQPTGNAAVQVACQPPGGPLLPDPGQVPYERAGTVGASTLGVAKEPLPVYTVGTKVASWRIVQLDNAKYLELTIAW